MTTEEYVKAILEQNSGLVIDLIKAVYETCETSNQELLEAIEMVLSYYKVQDIMDK